MFSIQAIATQHKASNHTGVFIDCHVGKCEIMWNQVVTALIKAGK
jgi:hypothetical protein